MGKSRSTQGLGWFLAGLLFLSTQAWGLDLENSIARKEADSAQILSTLGRGKRVAASVSPASLSHPVKIKLIKKKSAKKKSVRNKKARKVAAKHRV